MSSVSQLCELTLTKASELLRDRVISPIELTQACLDRIQALDKSFNAFITVAAESALQQERTA